MKIQITFILALILLTTSLVSAIPGIPHQFYGSVTVNGQSAPDNNVLVASIEGDEYVTVTKNGKFGYSPNIFYAEDPEGNRKGDITFYLGGKEVGIITFEKNGYTEFDILTTTSCGDGYCLGDETCSSCQHDCGICTDPPIITIVSPEQDGVYNNVKINLEVMADQEIIVWMYALNDLDPIIFIPNIILTLEERNYELTVIGLSKENYLSGSRTVSFSIEFPEPYCGDDICNNGETCTTCPGDCGVCPTPTPPSTGGGSSGGGGGGGSYSSPSTTSGSGTATTNLLSINNGNGVVNLSSSETQQTTGPGITGAVIGFVKSSVGIGSIFAVLLLIAGIVVLTFRKKNPKQTPKE